MTRTTHHEISISINPKSSESNILFNSSENVYREIGVFFNKNIPMNFILKKKKK